MAEGQVRLAHEIRAHLLRIPARNNIDSSARNARLTFCQTLGGGGQHLTTRSPDAHPHIHELTVVQLQPHVVLGCYCTAVNRVNRGRPDIHINTVIVTPPQVVHNVLAGTPFVASHITVDREASDVHIARSGHANHLEAMHGDDVGELGIGVGKTKVLLDEVSFVLPVSHIRGPVTLMSGNPVLILLRQLLDVMILLLRASVDVLLCPKITFAGIGAAGGRFKVVRPQVGWGRCGLGVIKVLIDYLGGEVGELRRIILVDHSEVEIVIVTSGPLNLKGLVSPDLKMWV
mmetsp:Transcript_7215/g.8149  ORF Transcript_7215/g.8149 Transcript_7215/m.8149 type:complete len:288 (+) Transcript_7215:519-1382(+)